MKIWEQFEGRLGHTQRRRYAWRPIRKWRTPRPFTEPIGWMWFRWVIETRTIDGWIAYEEDNGGRLASTWVKTEG